MNNKSNQTETSKTFFSIDKNLFIYESKIAATTAVGSKIANSIIHKSDQVLGLISSNDVDDVYRSIINVLQQPNQHTVNCKAFITAEFTNLKEAKYSLFNDINQKFLAHTSIKPENIFVPSKVQIGNYSCLTPEFFHQKLAAIGPIDIQLLTVGNNGELSFNMPTNEVTSLNATTRVVDLNIKKEEFRDQGLFNEANVPTQVTTMSLLELIYGKNIHLLAFGLEKVPALKKLFTAQDYDPNWPITALIYAKGKVTIYTDFLTANELKEQLKK